MTDFYQIQAPAKINLFLHVVGQRHDGYHLIQSVFQLVNLFDTIEIKALSNPSLELSIPTPNVKAKDDLVLRAAQLLQNYTQSSLGAEIRVNKNIPIGAGMGGGSSDAASTLIALNELWRTHLPIEELCSLGIKLGADVPFFINGVNAFVEGIGEKLTAIDLQPYDYFIIYPGIRISTQEIFNDTELTRNHRQITILDFAEYESSKTFLSNDLEPIARKKYLVVTEAIEWLKMKIPGSNPMMTGSGSAVFCRLPPHFEAQNMLSQLPINWRGFIVRGLNQHPAYNLIRSSNKQQGSRQVG